MSQRAMTPEREAELREYAESLAADYERPALAEALDAMAYERSDRDAWKARALRAEAQVTSAYAWIARARLGEVSDLRGLLAELDS